MKKVQLISKIDQGHYSKGQLIRTVKVEKNFNINSITEYYDLKVTAIEI